jgi:hypothetical protein
MCFQGRYGLTWRAGSPDWPNLTIAQRFPAPAADKHCRCKTLPPATCAIPPISRFAVVTTAPKRNPRWGDCETAARLVRPVDKPAAVLTALLPRVLPPGGRAASLLPRGRFCRLREAPSPDRSWQCPTPERMLIGPGRSSLVGCQDRLCQRCHRPTPTRHHDFADR